VRLAQQEDGEESNLFRMVLLPTRSVGIQGLRDAIARTIGPTCQILLLPDVLIESDADVLLLNDGDMLEVTLEAQLNEQTK